MLATNYKVWDKIQSRKNVGFFTASNQNEVSAHMTNYPYTSIIWLTQGKYAIVDNEDCKLLAHYKWRYDGGYARANILVNKTRTSIRMHRLIMNVLGLDIYIDHINHNGLDNRKVNLRLANPSENQRNSLPKRYGLSVFKGVSWHKKHSKWQARIRVDSKRLFLGLFKDDVDAAQAYDKAAIQYHGKFALTNEMLELYNTTRICPKDNVLKPVVVRKKTSEGI